MKTKILFIGLVVIGLSACGLLQPQIDSITPDHGSELGGTEVTIKGSRFEELSGVSIGNKVCIVTESSDDTIVCTTQARPVDSDTTVNVTIVRVDEYSADLENGFTYTNE